MNKARISKSTSSILIPLVLVACGGGSNSPENNTSFLIGGTVSGLVENKQVVLQNNGEDELSVIQNGSFSFKKTVSPDANYSVTVKTQPDGLNCTVAAGSGKATTDINNIKVECTPAAVAQLTGKWYMRDYCRGTPAPGLYLQNTVDIKIPGNMPTISYGDHVYGYPDCKQVFSGEIKGLTYTTETVRSTFVHEGITIIRLSLFSAEYSIKASQAFWIPLQKKSICVIDDDIAKSDEVLAKDIMGITNTSRVCYFPLE